MSLVEKIVAQFGHPRGLFGRVTGFIMAHRPSNAERNLWVVSLLELQPTDIVLEVGFGPGVAIERMSHLIMSGKVYGIDHSEVMLHQATRRNREAIEAGRVILAQASVADWPGFNVLFAKVLDVNSFQFWHDQAGSLKSIRDRMKPGALIALGHQPRHPGATEKDADQAALMFGELMSRTGFKDVRSEKKATKPISTICVLGSS